MKSRLHWLAAVAGLHFAHPALAHPGHEGHELTWDFGHLANHPAATLVCVGIILAGVWTAIETRTSLPFPRCGSILPLDEGTNSSGPRSPTI